ncbi:MAG TPA: ribosome biogenesis GTP-binding protein YihA/YsxC [Vicinamibacterales bacterium]|nr:ribosome biogenesis GTP-binding protein YihA/YsxC [Vicinamibacterales bacterium]
MKIAAEFVTSAAGPEGFPVDGAPEIALVGRSNVGKSSLINALVRQRLARTSAAPGKTRLVNLYRVRFGSAPAFYLVDLPGYGYARGGSAAARVFERLTADYFAPAGAREPRPAVADTLLLVDARHPGLPADREACAWLAGLGYPVRVVVTKLDKLSRAERARTMRAVESAFDAPAQPVSAVTGEGMDELWRQIIRQVSARRPRTPPSRA